MLFFRNSTRGFLVPLTQWVQELCICPGCTSLRPRVHSRGPGGGRCQTWGHTGSPAVITADRRPPGWMTSCPSWVTGSRRQHWQQPSPRASRLQSLQSRSVLHYFLHLHRRCRGEDSSPPSGRGRHFSPAPCMVGTLQGLPRTGSHPESAAQSSSGLKSHPDTSPGLWFFVFKLGDLEHLQEAEGGRRAFGVASHRQVRSCPSMSSLSVASRRGPRTLAHAHCILRTWISVRVKALKKSCFR